MTTPPRIPARIHHAGTPEYRHTIYTRPAAPTPPPRDYGLAGVIAFTVALALGLALCWITAAGGYIGGTP